MEDSRRLGEPLGLDGLYDLYAERIEAYQADPPGSGWGGVFIATTK
jgi:adenylate cyclase